MFHVMHVVRGDLISFSLPASKLDLTFEELLTVLGEAGVQPNPDGAETCPDDRS